MPTFEIEANGKRFQVEAATAQEATSALDNMPAAPGITGGENRAAAVSALRGIPVLGAYADKGAAALNAALQPVIGSPGMSQAQSFGERYNENLPKITAGGNQFEQQYPISSTVGQIGMGAAALAPIGATALGARALGLGGQTLTGMATRGAASGAGLGAADTAARGGDVGTGAAIGGLAGAAFPVAGRAVSAALSPAVTAPGRQALVNTLEQEGIGVTAGQRTGSRAVQYAESTLGDFPGAGGQATRAMEDQGRQFTEATLRRVGVNGAPTRQNLDAQVTNLENNFQTLSNRNTLIYDPQFSRDLTTVINRYDRKLPSQQRDVVQNYIHDIAQFPGQMPGDVYQVTRSDLSKQAHGARNSDPTFSDALRGLRNALDNAMARSISPADQALWQQTRRQYANFKTIENAAKNTDPAGNIRITPAALTQAASARNRGQFARGQGDFAQLAQAAAPILQSLPQSGTTPRAVAAGLPTALAATLSGLNPLALAGVAAPMAAGRLIMTRPVQAYLGNQVFRQNMPLTQNILGIGSRSLLPMLDNRNNQKQ